MSQPVSLDPTEILEASFDGEHPVHSNGLREVRTGTTSALAHQIRFYKRMDTALISQPAVPGQTIDCRSGCSYCCHYHVYISAPEALAIAEHMTSAPAAFLETVLAKLRANAAHVASLGLDQHMVTNIACAFLKG